MKYNEELMIKARKNTMLKLAFYIHLSVYITVNLILFFIWYFTYNLYSFPWFLAPLIGWGTAIIGHGITTYRGGSYLDKKIKKEYDKLMDGKHYN